MGMRSAQRRRSRWEFTWRRFSAPKNRSGHRSRRFRSKGEDGAAWWPGSPPAAAHGLLIGGVHGLVVRGLRQDGGCSSYLHSGVADRRRPS